MKKIIILVLTTILLSGCSYVELDDLAIVSAIGVDYKDNLFHLTAQVMDAKRSDSGMDESSLIYEAEGETIASAVRNFAEKYPKNAYFGHLEMIVLGGETVKYKLDDIFDYFMRSPEVRSSGFILISKDQTAKNILKPQNEKQGSFASEELKSSLEGATKRNGTVNDITFEQFLSHYLQKGIDPVVPLIKLSNDESSNSVSQTTITELAVIKDGKISKSLTKEESIAYNTLNNTYYDIVITPKHDNKPFGAIILNPKSSIKTKIKNNKIKVNININIETKLNELNQKIDPKNEKIHDQLQKEIENELKSYFESLIKYCKETNTDILGIGNMIYKNYYKEYKKYENKNLYEIASININIKSKMYRYGKITEGAA